MNDEQKLHQQYENERTIRDALRVTELMIADAQVELAALCLKMVRNGPQGAFMKWLDGDDVQKADEVLAALEGFIQTEKALRHGRDLSAELPPYDEWLAAKQAMIAGEEKADGQESK